MPPECPLYSHVRSTTIPYYIVLTRHAWSPSDDTAALAAITAPCLMRARQGLSKRDASHADPYGIQPDGFALVTVRRGSGAPAC